MSITGQCLCGSVKYEFDNPPAMNGICHCKNCQRQAGSAFSTLAGVPKAEFRFTEGEPKLYEDTDTVSGNRVERWFCGNCGSPIYSALDSNEDMIFLKTGTLDDTSGFSPQFQVWCDSKQDWVALVDGVPAMPRAYPPCRLSNGGSELIAEVQTPEQACDIGFRQFFAVQLQLTLIEQIAG